MCYPVMAMFIYTVLSFLEDNVWTIIISYIIVKGMWCSLKLLSHTLSAPIIVKDARSVFLYPYIHKSCNMLCVLIKLTLQKKLQFVVTNNVFLDKKV